MSIKFIEYMSNHTTTTRSNQAQPGADWVAVVQKKVEALRYGVVQVVVHEGRVVQIECTEKVRIDRPERDDE